MMYVYRTIRYCLLIFLLVIPFTLAAQDDGDAKPTRKQKKAEQKKEQRAKDVKKAEIKGKKRHMKLQDKQTQKRMKKNKKKGTRYVSRRSGFWDRIMKPFR